MATPSTHLKEFNNSRVSLVPTENSSDLGFELDAEEFSFQDWESSLRKDTPSTTKQRLSWLTIPLWLGRLLLLMLLLFAVYCRGWERLEGKRFFQDAVGEMVAWGVTFETSPDAIKRTENVRQLEAAVQELLTTSSALLASQRHVDTMSKELDQVHETVSQLEQQLQSATENMEVTRENLDATIEMLNDAKSALQKKEQQLTTLQHHMAHLEHELEHSQTKLRRALADLDGALLGMGQTQVELDETMLLLQTTSARLQESEKGQTILKENLVAASFDDLGRGLELEGLRIELSNLQSMYAVQAQELIVTRFEVSSLSTDSAATDVAFKEHIAILNQQKNELSLRTQLLQRLEAQVEGSAAELVDVRNELIETNALLSYSEQELLSAETSHLQTKDELSSTVTELLETQSALQDAIEVLLDFEEQIDSLHERLATQEKLAAHTINFVSTMAINQQQRAAAEVVNFMTTFAIRYQRDAVASESPAQEVQTYPMADAAFVFEQPQHEASIVDFDEAE
jgi:chromosome segregation ATPase